MPSPPRTSTPPLRILVSDLGRTRVIGPSFHDDPAGAVGAMTDNALSPADTPASEAPETSNAPTTPYPNTPQNPNTPDTRQPPQPPHIPEAPQPPHIPEAPQTPDTPQTPHTSATPHIPEPPGTPALRGTPGTTGTAGIGPGAATILAADPVATFPCDASPEEISAALREVQLTPAGSVEAAPAARRERLQQLCAWLAAALHTPTRRQQTPAAEPT